MIGLGIMEREAFQAIQILLPNLYKNDMNPSVRQKEGVEGYALWDHVVGVVFEPTFNVID